MATITTDAVEAGKANFSNAVEAARLQLEAVEALGHYKLAVAQAELVNAYARSEHAKAGARETVVRQLSRALAQLQSQRAVIQRQIRTWAKLAQRLALVQDGENISPAGISQMWQALAIYQRLATRDVHHEIERLEVTPSERKRSLYVVIKSSGNEPLADDLPDDIDNGAALIAWLQRQKRVMPKRGRRPFQIVRDAFLALAGKRATEEIAGLQKLMLDIERGTLSAWQPIMLAPFLDNAAITKLIDIKPVK